MERDGVEDIVIYQGSDKILLCVHSHRLYAAHSWCINMSKTGQKYLRGYSRDVKNIYFHRLLLGAESTLQVDHINGNTLDNRLCNLRLVTARQNAANTRARTGKKGVCFRPDKNMWQARLRGVHLGYFKTEQDADIAYKVEAERVYGEFAFHVSRKTE